MKPNDDATAAHHPGTDVVTPRGVRASRPTEGRDRKPRRWPAPPCDVTQAEVDRARGKGTEAAKRHRNNALARLRNEECSHVWAHDIWAGRDRNYADGGYTGSGSGKVRCTGECNRRTPPQNVAAAQTRAERRDGVPAHPVCDDCRECRRAPKERVPRTNVNDAAPVGTPVVLVEVGQPAPIAAVLDSVENRGLKVVQRRWGVGGMADPGDPPVLPEDATPEERAVADDDYARDLAAYRADERAMVDALARYEAAMRAEPSRQREWVKQYERDTGIAAQRAADRNRHREEKARLDAASAESEHP